MTEVTDAEVEAFWSGYTDDQRKAVVPLTDHLRKDIRLGLQAARAARPEPEGMETTAEERKQWTLQVARAKEEGGR